MRRERAVQVPLDQVTDHCEGGARGDRIGRITTAVGPQVAILTRAVRADARGVARIVLSCEAGTGVCSGPLRATAAIRVRQRVKGTTRVRTVSKTIVAGRGSFSIPAGGRATVKLTLSRSALQRLARPKRARLATELRAISEGGDARRTVTFTRQA